MNDKFFRPNSFKARQAKRTLWDRIIEPILKAALCIAAGVLLATIFEK